MHIFKTIAVGAVTLLAGGAVYALPTPSLSLSEVGYATHTIALGPSGSVLFDGAYGTWAVNADAGDSYPLLGTETDPVLDLSYDAVAKVKGNALTITFLDLYGPILTSTIENMVNGNGKSVNTTVKIFQDSTLLGSYSSVNGILDVDKLLAVKGKTATDLEIQVTLTNLLTNTSQKSGVSANASGDALEVYNPLPDTASTGLLLSIGIALMGTLVWSRRNRHPAA